MLKNIKDGITAADAAKKLGVDAQTVRNWIKTGKLPATEWGPEGARVVRIDRKDLEGLGPRPVAPDLDESK
jgi:excisionase family DNA binding protein